MSIATRAYGAAIFDLDGVLVDTAKYHYLAWKETASKLGIDFAGADNERLKGDGRMECLDIILSMGNRMLGTAEKERLASEKNYMYLSYVNSMDESNLLDGAQDFLVDCRNAGIRTALASASKNAKLIIDRIGIRDLLDVIVDGTMVIHSKPDPEVFLLAASLLGVEPVCCVVFEDAVAGIQAAKLAGMKAIGIGQGNVLHEADIVIPGLQCAGLSILGWDN